MQAARGASLNDATDPQTDVPVSRTPARVLFVILAGVLLALDQVTKAWALKTQSPGVYQDVVGDLLRFTLVRNPGASFGIGTDYTEVITVLAMIATVVTLWFAFRNTSWWWGLAFGFLMAGVVGNLIDRVVRPPGGFGGHVIDFLALPNWPVFNVADICVNIAAVLILILAWRGVDLNPPAPESAPEPKPEEQ